mgnify:CR=1 FL=1
MIDTTQDKKELSRKLKERAILEGFTVAGIASIPGSSRVKLRTNALERWLSNNYHAEMKWMESEKRKNIGSLFEDAKSVLSVGFTYINSQNNNNNFLKVAKFSQGEDYHKVIHKKLKNIEKERKEKEKQIKLEEQLRRNLKNQELRQEIRIERERKKDIKNFLRKEQAEIRKEQAERQRKFLFELKLEKQIENFKKREVKELQNLERITLKEERSDYAGLQVRIEKLKEKYRAIRDQKIKERVEALGVEVQQGDDREALLEKEKQYTLERQKIENCLESFYRSSVSLCFQINKRYIPKHRSILRVIDLRFEQSEIYIRWDDAPEEDWLLLIYIKNNSPKEDIVIEDKTDPEKNISHEFKTTEIFKASDMMVDSLIGLLERERKKKAS